MDRVHFTDWRAVASLSEPHQRDLISTGDPAERVWAIWAVGLHLGRGALSKLHQDLDREPVSGVRCQLIVVLAGLGERELVRNVALEDPDPVVRATACKYVVRTLPVGSEAAVEFALERMRRDVPRVQHAMFEEVQSGRLRLPDGALAEFLAHADLDTRQLSFESIASLPRPSEEMVRLLADRALQEPDAILRRACRDLYLRHGAAAYLAHAAREAPGPIVCEVLSALRRRGVQLTWTEVVPLASRWDAEISLAVLRGLVEPLEPDAIRWVSSVTAAALVTPTIHRAGASPLGEFRWEALSMLYKAIAPETVPLFDRSVAEALLDWVADADEEDEVSAAGAVVRRGLLERHLARPPGSGG